MIHTDHHDPAFRYEGLARAAFVNPRKKIILCQGMVRLILTKCFSCILVMTDAKKTLELLK